MPGTGQAIKWTDSYSDDIRTASFLPMLLDVVDGAAYLVVTPMGCLSYNKWGRPNPPYVVFKYEAKEWKRIPLQELPAAIKTPNMISSMPDIEAKRIGGNPVSAEAISKLVSQYRSSEYRTILREPNDSDTPQSCIYMTKDPRGGWRQIGTSISKPSYEECEQYCKSFQIAPAYCPCNGIYKKGN